MTTKEIGAKLQYYRKAKGITQGTLANITGITKSYISNIENGKANVTVENLLKICETLNVKIEI